VRSTSSLPSSFPQIPCCHRYDTARKLKEQQDAYCTRALAGEWEDLGEFTDNLQWEALVDVLRGRVKACFNFLSEPTLLCGVTC
jgi:hypothetical protein